LEKAIRRFEKLRWNKKELIKQARKFSREKFEEGVKKIVGKIVIDEK